MNRIVVQPVFPTIASLVFLAVIQMASAESEKNRPTTQTATGALYRVAVKITTPKDGRDKRVSLPLDEVAYNMFVASDVKVIRGAVFNPFHENAALQEHWQTAAGLWDFAVIGTNLFRVKNEEVGLTTLAGLKELARASGHPEVEHMPLCVVGMSIGAGLSVRIAETLPERVIAGGPVCLEVGPRDAASMRIPMITIFGERDGKQMQLLADKLPVARRERAQWATAVQWRRRHEFFRANDLLMPLFDHAIRHRYPSGAAPLKGPVALNDYDEAQGWLGDPATWDGPLPRTAPVAEYQGDPSRACWLPDGYVAAVWQAFVTREPKLTITAPKGMGDGEPFAAHAASTPLDVTVSAAPDIKFRKIELLDGDRRLGEFTGTPPQLTLNHLAPGVLALIAAGTSESGDRAVSRPNTILVIAPTPEKR